MINRIMVYPSDCFCPILNGIKLITSNQRLNKKNKYKISVCTKTLYAIKAIMVSVALNIGPIDVITIFSRVVNGSVRTVDVTLLNKKNLRIII